LSNRMEIVLSRVLRVSSEEENRPASNLLDSTRKREWVIETPGQSEAFVEIAFAQKSRIVAIDIGNMGSAFVAVEVGVGEKPNEWFAFLPATKFMDSLDSRNGVGVKKVTLFVSDQFHVKHRDREWDRIRVTCQQMFVKSRKFGLSFIVLRKEIPESRTVNTKNMIKQKEKEMLKKLAVESKAAKAAAVASVESFKPDEFINRSLYPNSTEPTRPKSKVQVASSLNNSLKRQANFATKADSMTSKRQKISPSSSNDTTENERKLTRLESKPKTGGGRELSRLGKKKVTGKAVPFSEIMSGCVFAISGYVNPQRGRIRDAALAMGARFDKDISNRTTHLVCAFANTPKYNQFIGRGKIMKKEWIFLQYETKKKLPWKKYSLAPVSESEAENSEAEEGSYSPVEQFSSGSSDEEQVPTIIRKAASPVPTTPTIPEKEIVL